MKKGLIILLLFSCYVNSLYSQEKKALLHLQSKRNLILKTCLDEQKRCIFATLEDNGICHISRFNRSGKLVGTQSLQLGSFPQSLLEIIATTHNELYILTKRQDISQANEGTHTIYRIHPKRGLLNSTQLNCAEITLRAFDGQLVGFIKQPNQYDPLQISAYPFQTSLFYFSPSLNITQCNRLYIHSGKGYSKSFAPQFKLRGRMHYNWFAEADSSQLQYQIYLFDKDGKNLQQIPVDSCAFAIQSLTPSSNKLLFFLGARAYCWINDKAANPRTDFEGRLLSAIIDEQQIAMLVTSQPGTYTLKVAEWASPSKITTIPLGVLNEQHNNIQIEKIASGYRLFYEISNNNERDVFYFDITSK